MPSLGLSFALSAPCVLNDSPLNLHSDAYHHARNIFPEDPVSVVWMKRDALYLDLHEYLSLILLFSSSYSLCNSRLVHDIKLPCYANKFFSPYIQLQLTLDRSMCKTQKHTQLIIYQTKSSSFFQYMLFFLYITLEFVTQEPHDRSLEIYPYIPSSTSLQNSVKHHVL